MRKIFGIICIIAELTGKQHKNLKQAIRKMEPAWEKVQGLKFQLCEKKLPSGEWRNEETTFLPTHQDRVPVHRHEVEL